MKHRKLMELSLCFSFLGLLNGCKANIDTDKDFLIQFDTRSEKGVIENNLHYGEEIKAPEVSKDGYNLKAWLLDGEAVNPNDCKAYKDYTFVAEWEAISHDIHFEYHNFSYLKENDFQISYPSTASFNQNISFSVTTNTDVQNIQFVWAVDQEIASTDSSFNMEMPDKDINVSLTIYNSDYVYSENSVYYSYRRGEQGLSICIYNLDGFDKFPSHFCDIPIQNIYIYCQENTSGNLDWTFPDTIRLIDINQNLKGVRSITIGKNVQIIRSVPRDIEKLTISKENPFFSDGNANIVLNKEETELYRVTNALTSFPSTLKVISSWALYYFDAKDRDLIFPDSLEEIGPEAFRSAIIHKIKLPAKLKEISPYAFINSHFQYIECDGGENYYSDKDNSCLVKRDTQELLITSSNFKVIPDGVKIIGLYSFSYRNNPSLKELIIPDSVTDWLYPDQIENLESLYIGAGLKNLTITDELGYYYLTVSENNKYFASKDGSLLDKKTNAILVVGNTNTLPADTDSLISFCNRNYIKKQTTMYLIDVTNNIIHFREEYPVFYMPDQIKNYVGTNMLNDFSGPKDIVFNPADSICSKAILNAGSINILLPKGIKKIEKNFIYFDKTDIKDPKNVHIYCEDASKPEGWDDDWNKCDETNTIDTTWGTNEYQFRKRIEKKIIDRLYK